MPGTQTLQSKKEAAGGSYGALSETTGYQERENQKLILFLAHLPGSG